MAITFQNLSIGHRLKNKSNLKNWLRLVIEKEKKSEGIINYVLTSDAELLQRNKAFLNHDTYTDIITFENNEGKKIGGDIMISIERVTENAQKFEVGFESELRRVMVHGVLHLCGYRDKTSDEKDKMRKLENRYLKLFEKTI